MGGSRLGVVGCCDRWCGTQGLLAACRRRRLRHGGGGDRAGHRCCPQRHMAVCRRRQRRASGNTRERGASLEKGKGGYATGRMHRSKQGRHPMCDFAAFSSVAAPLTTFPSTNTKDHEPNRTRGLQISRREGSGDKRKPKGSAGSPHRSKPGTPSGNHIQITRAAVIRRDTAHALVFEIGRDSEISTWSPSLYVLASSCA